MEILGIDNLFFQVGSLEEAVPFYEKLGFVLKFKIPRINAALFNIGEEEPGLMLFENKEPKPSRFWVEVDSALQAQKTLKIGSLIETTTGFTFEVLDPWENTIGFADYSKKKELARKIKSPLIRTLTKIDISKDAFSRIMGTPPSKSENHKALKASWIDTPLGPMLVVADDEVLYLLEFVDRRGLEKEIERLKNKTKLPIIPGKTNSAKQVEVELEGYFSGKIQEFKTPLLLIGSPFQKKVWEELQKIPKGETRSYSEIAKVIGKPSAFRAVASANGANQFAIVIPCHRVINSNGGLSGYGGGIKRKEWLLKHERK